MGWSVPDWQAKLENLVERCADRVLAEMEEEITMRLRVHGRSWLDSILTPAADLFTLEAAPTEAGVLTNLNFDADQHAAQTASTEDENGPVPTETGGDTRSLSQSPKEAVQPDIGPQTSDIDPWAEAHDQDIHSDLELWYAFAVVAGQASLPGLAGMEDRSCRLISADSLGMVVCPVPWSEYNQEAMHMHMEELAWVESHARRHEEVLQTIIETTPAVPLPFATVFVSEERVGQELTGKARILNRELERLGTSREMLVTLFFNREVITNKLKDTLPYRGEPGGAGYFEKKRWEKNLEKHVEALCQEYGENLYRSLQEPAQEVQLQDTAGNEAQPGLSPVFAARFLIYGTVLPDWQEKIEAFDREADSWGFVLDVSGPWPPYHFTGLRGEESNGGGISGCEAGKTVGGAGKTAG